MKRITMYAALSLSASLASFSYGAVLVTDFENDAIYQFSDTGSYIGIWADSSSGLSSPSDIASDSQGNVYVYNAAGGFVTTFDQAGNLITSFNLGVGAQSRSLAIDSNDVLHVDEFNDIEKYDANGNFLGTHIDPNTSNGGGVRYAFDGNDNFFMIENSIIPFEARVRQFDSAGNELGIYGDTGLVDTGGFSYEDLAFDSSNNLYLADGVDVYKFDSAGNSLGLFCDDCLLYGLFIDQTGNIWGRHANEGRIDQYDSSGTFLGTIVENGVDSVPSDFRTFGMTSISPVPLPAGAWLFLSAIGGLVGIKARGRAK